MALPLVSRDFNVRWSRPCSPRPHDIASIDFNTSTPLYDVNRASNIPFSSSSLHWSIDRSIRSFAYLNSSAFFLRTKRQFFEIDHVFAHRYSNVYVMLIYSWDTFEGLILDNNINIKMYENLKIFLEIFFFFLNMLWYTNVLIKRIHVVFRDELRRILARGVCENLKMSQKYPVTYKYRDSRI